MHHVYRCNWVCKMHFQAESWKIRFTLQFSNWQRIQYKIDVERNGKFCRNLQHGSKFRIKTRLDLIGVDPNCTTHTKIYSHIQDSTHPPISIHIFMGFKRAKTSIQCYWHFSTYLCRLVCSSLPTRAVLYTELSPSVSAVILHKSHVIDDNTLYLY